MQMYSLSYIKSMAQLEADKIKQQEM